MTKGTLKPQRFITAVDMIHPEFTEQLSRELWKRIYEEVGLYSSPHCSPLSRRLVPDWHDLVWGESLAQRGRFRRCSSQMLVHLVFFGFFFN